jgi:diketogulonate reductase-like aldo/keto reductase
MAAQTSLKLSNGASMPSLGYGTWLAKTDEVAQGVKWAIESGYRHLDCAERYGNQVSPLGVGVAQLLMYNIETNWTSSL